MIRSFRLLYIAAFGIFCAGPLAIVVSTAFSDTRFLTFPPRGFSLRWFFELFTDKLWFGALTNSAMIALSSSTLAVAIALPISYTAWRYNLKFARTLMALGLAPFVMPPVIMALGFLLLFTGLHVHGYFMNGVIAHAISFLALPLVTISLGFESIDRSLMDASGTMGATSRQIFWTILFPLIRPYIVAGFAFCLVISLNEYIILLMTIGFSYETLPVRVFNALRNGYSPIISAVAVLFLTTNILVFGAIAIFGNLPRLMGELDKS